MTEQSEYKVDLDTYSGPLDLLLYLIKRDEVDLWNIPIARITEQYLKYLDLMSELNVNVAGEFVVMAATLIEIKSRMMTPDPEPTEEEEADDPRMELVRQLMEYKRFKEAAVALNDRAEARAERFARPGEKPPELGGPQSAGVGGVSIWVLLEAFSKVLQQTGAKGPHMLVIDSIPQERIQAELEQRVAQAGRMTFFNAFEGQVTRIRLVGTFIALLELVRLQVIRIEQEQAFGEIWLTYVPPEQREAVPEPPPLTPLPSAEEPPAAPEPQPEEPQEDFEDLPQEADIALPDVPEVDGPEPPATPKPSSDDDAVVIDDAEDEYEDEEEDEDEDDEEEKEKDDA